MASPTAAAHLDLLRFLERRRPVVVTGAGCSTESGIPDYRGPNGTLRTRQPMRFQEFMSSAAARRRYWSRSVVGWPRFNRAGPNAAHHALAALEQGGRIAGLITQNVDGLHQAAGSDNVIELHGSLGQVRCMGCGGTRTRADMQDALESLNPEAVTRPNRYIADGDAEVDPSHQADFAVPACEKCGGILKPDVVYFGESVPRGRVDACWEMYEAADSVLVVGSSLTVFSGRRFVLRAEKEGVPVAILNLGATRGDAAAALKVDAPVGPALSEVAKRLA